MTVLIVAIAAFCVGALIFWMQSRDIGLTWYEWTIGVIGLLLLMFGTINFFGSFAEQEETAGWMFLLFFGLPALILLVLSWQLAARRIRAS
jgi:hypothetical protein